MRGMIGGIVSGGMVSVLALSVASVIGEQPAGVTPPSPPLVNAPAADVTPEPVETSTDLTVSTPVGSVSIEEPQAPALPDAEAALAEPGSPVSVEADQSAPSADTDPLDEPAVVAIEGTLDAPATSENAGLQADAFDPVLPNPQSIAPQTPVTESNLTVSTAPAAPVVVVEPVDEPEPAPDVAQETTGIPDQETTGSVVIQGTETDETFVVDLGINAAGTDSDTVDAAESAADAPQTEPLTVADGEDGALDDDVPPAESEDGVTTNASPFAQSEADEVRPEPAGRFQLQGNENTLLSDRGTGVTVRRLGAETPEDAEVETTATDDEGVMNALVDYAASADDPAGRPLMSIVLIDDGSMSAASAALAGLPFGVTIALDPAMEGVAEAMTGYRADGFEVAVLAKVPEGAVPSDVEITFESVFQTLPESIAVLDIGEGGLQADREVTGQAMEILAAQGRGFVTISQGLNTATRAAEQAGVAAGVVYRELDADGQDARVVRRFVDQAAFRARQESGVILVGRVRPDTISALILWGTANQNDQVAIVPLSTVLNAE